MDAGLAITILDHVCVLVTQILTARSELQDAPRKVLDLVDVVETAEVRLNKLRETDLPAELSFRKCLQDLGTELVSAQEKVEKYKRKQAQRKNEALEIAKAAFQQGVVKQNRETESIRERLRKLLEQLDQLLTVDSNLKITSLSTTTLDSNAKLTTLSETVEMTLKLVRPPLPATPVLVSLLDQLAILSLDDEECEVDLEIASSHTSDFQAPLVELQRLSSQEIIKDDGNRRAATEGGYEIANSSKVRFSIKVEEDRCFYVIVYDATEATEPSLFFPLSTSMKYKVDSNFKRKFPDPVKYRSDPLSMVIEKSERLGTDGVGRQNVYILLSCSKLHPDNLKLVNLGDIEENIDNEVFVRKFIFDVK
ncbi:hypothetical protein O6H91_04G125200 [Diphasiastrum complanatum]|uniref:Uncharacterized protein n=1 Tax=Diphasiastrum complanatum TaxID=34168 RepID=A0ACC2E149_DIPCM|nr:hypothetical protein O6H91_04G125200 [Diphasiastrum complanatum]